MSNTILAYYPTISPENISLINHVMHVTLFPKISNNLLALYGYHVNIYFFIFSYDI